MKRFSEILTCSITFFLLTLAACGGTGDKKTDTDTDTAVPDIPQPDNTADTNSITPETAQPDNDIQVINWTEYAGLSWSDKAPNTLNWYYAMDYCTKMGGRLPTISELRKIIINCPNTMTNGVCQVSSEEPGCLMDSCRNDDCYCDCSASSYSALGDDKSNNLWSSSSCLNNTGDAWYVSFQSGNVGRAYKQFPDTHVRCVR